MNTEKVYYIHRPNVKHGPLDLQSLVETLNTLKASPETQIFCIGWQQWKRLKDIPELQDLISHNRLNPNTQLPKSARTFVEKNQRIQQNRTGCDGYVTFRFSPWHNITHQPLIPPPQTAPWWLKSLVAFGALTLGGVIMLIVHQVLR